MPKEQRVLCCHRYPEWGVLVGIKGPPSAVLSALTCSCSGLALPPCGWGVLSVPYSCWPWSENCVSSLWRAVSDQCSGGEIVSLSFLLGRKVMNTCSLIEHIEHIGYKITSMNILLTQASLGLLCWWTWSYQVKLLTYIIQTLVSFK